MRIDILTLFPSMFYGILNNSIIKIAREKKIVDIRLNNFRNFTYDKHNKVDDRPYGGGPGMILKPEPIVRAVESIKFNNINNNITCILLTPQGKVYNQKIARELSKKEHLILICGHYEGFDERIKKILKPLEISIGNYILTGGEIPAMVIIDSVIRLLPGVLGNNETPYSESFENNLLDYPQYTRPKIWRGLEVPSILTTGNHKEIEKWRKEQAYKITLQKRPELLKDKNNK